MWTMRDAWELIELWEQVAARCGYALALFGSVLKRGEGNDLDLVAFPANRAATMPLGLVAALVATLDRDTLDVCKSKAVTVPNATGWQIYTGVKHIDLVVIGKGES